MGKQILLYLILALSIQASGQRQDTTIAGVLIGFTYAPSIFPESWLAKPTNATGSPIDPAEIRRSKAVIAVALNKYPSQLLQYTLKHVYFLKEMKFYNVGFGGTNSSDAVYITNQGTSLGYTDKYLEQTFHHEFSSILLRNYPAFLDTNLWKSANIGGFIYNDPENGVGAIRNNESSQALDTLFCKKGLLTQYAGSGIENDVNTLAQNLFAPEKDFWNYVDRFPRIRKKVDLLIRFYAQINKMFTEDYFRKMDSQ